MVATAYATFFALSLVLEDTRGEPLRATDLTGDGLVEVLSVQSFGASAETLYVPAWREDGWGLLRPEGGPFEGLGRFGETGVAVEDVDGGGIRGIVGFSGGAAQQRVVYRWFDGVYSHFE